MATISGSLRFDSARTGVSSPSLSGIANVPIVLQDTATGAMLAVYTDANGNYTFTNVPDGNYRIVEAFGQPAVPSPGDFSTAAVSGPVTAAFPPISYASNPPPNATNLDAITPTTLLVTVSGADLANQDILNGPVQYTPIETILDNNVIIFPANLITNADNGTFGTFPQGTAANTGAGPAPPYPEIGTQFTYVQPNPNVVAPQDGEYTVQNLMTDAVPQTGNNSWWRVADHTTGNETGRMMVVNGDTPGAIVFQQQVPVMPFTYYLFSTWILNLSKTTDITDPQMGVEVLAQDGSVLYNSTLGELIPINPNTPEWKQIGTLIDTKSNSSLTVRFTSQGPAQLGNDYVIDDIALQQIQIATYNPQKSASAPAVEVGDTVTYTVTLTNTGNYPLTAVAFQDLVPDGFTFVPGSVIVNGVGNPTADPNTGFTVPNILGGTALTVTFSAAADHVPAVNPTVNTASINYSYSPVNGGIPNQFTANTNPEQVLINEPADLAIVKTADMVSVQPGNVLTYTLAVTNNGPGPAQNVVVNDAVPPGLSNPEYSTDGGVTWQPWTGSLALGTLANGAAVTILLRGTVNPSAAGTIDNTASVGSTTFDPNPNNNSSTVETPVNDSADLAIVKTANMATVQPGDLLTYTLTVTNNGPSISQDTIINDTVPASLTNVEYSLDGGVTWQPWTGSYAPGNLSNGASIIILIRGTVAAGATGVIINTASVQSTTPDPNPNNNSSTVETPVGTVTAAADLAIVKTADKTAVQPGELLTYTLAVTNNGPDTAQNAIVNDTVPFGLTGPQYSTDGGATWLPWTGSLALGALANGAAVTILIRGTVNAAAAGIIDNTASVGSDTFDPNITNNSSTVETTVIDSADLAIVKTADLAVVQPGDVLTYTLSVTNLGPSNAQNFVLNDAVPASLSNVEYSLDGGATWLPWTGSYSLNVLANGAALTVLIHGTVTAAAVGTIDNTASVGSNTPDPNPGNNSSTIETPVSLVADMAIVKTADKAAVQNGEMLTYTLSVTNLGPGDAQNVIVTDAITSDLTNAQYSLDGGFTWLPWNDAIALGTMTSIVTVTILIRGTVNAQQSGIIVNTAIVGSDTPDPNPGNNISIITTTVFVPAADIEMVKTADKSSVLSGETLTYTLTVTNHGPDTAQSVTVVDSEPSIFTSPQYSTDGGVTWQAWTGSIAIGNMANGATASILLRGIVNTQENVLMANTATADSPTRDPNTDNNTSTVVTRVNMPPLTCEQARNRIISSIAMEELSLSHIINAEGEKLQYVLGGMSGSSGLNPTIGQVLQTNESVRKTLQSATQMQMFLSCKLNEAVKPCEE